MKKSKKLGKYSLGGLFKDITNTAGDFGKIYADQFLSTLGMGNVIQNKDFQTGIGKSLNTFNTNLDPVRKAVGAIGLNVVAPGLGTGVEALGTSLNPKDRTNITLPKTAPYINQTDPYGKQMLLGGVLGGEMKGGGWISKAINPAHKGYCTPMTKSTCTPHRKAFAMRAKAHFKADGGDIDAMENGDIIQYNVGTHESGNDQSVDSLGLPVNNPNDAVAKIEKQENSLNGFVFSDRLKPEGSNKTYAALAKKVDKKFGGKIDELGVHTKAMAYKILQDSNQAQIDAKLAKSASRYQKKYGGKLGNYPDGGDLGNFENWQTNTLNPNPSPDNYLFNLLGKTPPSLNKTTGTLDMSSVGIPNITSSAKLQDNGSYMDPNTSGITNHTEITPTVSNNSWQDYVSPAFNTIAAGVSALNKNKNYLQKTSSQPLRTLEQIPTNPDYSAAYARNTRSTRAADIQAGNYNPSIRGSLLANNLAQKLNADNTVAFTENQDKLNRVTDKLTKISQEQDRLNTVNQDYRHTFNVENTQDKALREQTTLGYLSNAVSDIGSIKNDKLTGTAVSQLFKYYNLDPDKWTLTWKGNQPIFTPK